MKGIDQLADAAVKSGTDLGKIGVTSRSDLADRLDGKPAQQVQLSGDSDQPLIVEMVRFADTTPK